MKYQRLEPAIKAWEQRNNASFYGDWNWEDLLRKEVSLEEAYPQKTNFLTSTNPNSNNNSGNVPSFTRSLASNPENKESNNPNRYISNSDSQSNSSPSTNPNNSSSPETNKAIYQGGFWGVALLFLLVTVILIKRKRVK
jgi:hypothetical protein